MLPQIIGSEFANASRDDVSKYAPLLNSFIYYFSDPFIRRLPKELSRDFSLTVEIWSEWMNTSTYSTDHIAKNIHSDRILWDFFLFMIADPENIEEDFLDDVDIDYIHQIEQIKSDDGLTYWDADEVSSEPFEISINSHTAIIPVLYQIETEAILALVSEWTAGEYIWGQRRFIGRGGITDASKYISHIEYLKENNYDNVMKHLLQRPQPIYTPGTQDPLTPNEENWTLTFEERVSPEAARAFRMSLPAVSEMRKTNPGALACWVHALTCASDCCELHPADLIASHPGEIIRIVRDRTRLGRGAAWRIFSKKPMNEFARLAGADRCRGVWRAVRASEIEAACGSGSPKAQNNVEIHFLRVKNTEVVNRWENYAPIIRAFFIESKRPERNSPERSWELGREFRYVLAWAQYQITGGEGETLASTTWNGYMRRHLKTSKSLYDSEMLYLTSIENGELKWKSALDEFGLNGYRIVPILNAQDLIQEGLRMHNCLTRTYENYIERCAQGTSRIFSVRDSDSDGHIANIEIKQDETRNEWNVSQVRGIANLCLSSAFDAMAQDIARQYNLAMNAGAGARETDETESRHSR